MRQPLRRSAVAILGLTLALLVPAAPPALAAADPTACKVNLFNDGTDAFIRSYQTFPDAVTGAAAQGSRLEVYGRCTAGVEIGKSIVISGMATATSGRPVLRAPASGRVLSVKGGFKVSINTITIRGGTATGSAPANQGGGIRNAGLLTLTSVIVRNNHAYDGGGIWTTSSGSANAKLVLTGDTRVMRNSADNHGGGVAVKNGSLDVLGRADVEHNSAVEGGGIDGANGTITIGGLARVHDNQGHFGAGLSAYTVTGTSFVSSIALNGTSEIDHNTSDGFGAAINVEGSLVTGAQSSIHDNTNTSDKGGIIDLYSYGVASGGTFNGPVTDNTAGPNGAVLVSWQDCGATPTVTGNIGRLFTDNTPTNLWLRTGTTDC